MFTLFKYSEAERVQSRVHGIEKSGMELSRLLNPCQARGQVSCRRLQILAAFSNIPEDVARIKRCSIFNNYSISASGEAAYFRSETILAAELEWKMRLFLPDLQCL